jgi:L-amino acid N-acyltransferase YncA
MIIRMAAVADAEAITEVHVASTVTAYATFFPADELARIDSRDRAARWRELLADGCTTTLIAEADGHAVGFINFGACRDDDLPQESVCEVMAEYVHPTVWRRGIGRRLMQEALDRLAVDGFRSVVVWTLESNGRAIEFYKEFSFVCDGTTHQRTMFGTSVAIIRLRGQLKAETV